VTSADFFTQIEAIINENIIYLNKYFINWYLILSHDKSVVIAFHLSNNKGNISIKVNIKDTVISNNEVPSYLGVKFLIFLIFKQQIEGVKIKSKQETIL